MTLREPPKKPQAVNLIGRFVGLIILLALFALVVWSVATNQQAAAIQRSDPLVHAPGEHLATQRGVIHRVEVGSGSATTVLVHHDTIAGGAPLRSLAEQIAESDRRVIVPDLVGFGFSSRPDEPGRRLSTSGQAESLGALLDEVEEGPYRLVGFGWGGEVATELAVLQPDLVESLVLVDTPELPVPHDGNHTLMGLPFGVGEAFAFTFEGAADQAVSRFQEECPAWAECSGETVELYRRAAAIPGTAEAIWARRASEPAFVAPGRLDELAMSVTVVAVETDRAAAEDLAGRFADAAVETVGASELAGFLSG